MTHESQSNIDEAWQSCMKSDTDSKTHQEEELILELQVKQELIQYTLLKV